MNNQCIEVRYGCSAAITQWVPLRGKPPAGPSGSPSASSEARPAAHLAQQSAPTGPHLENIVFTDLLALARDRSGAPCNRLLANEHRRGSGLRHRARGKASADRSKATENPGYNDTKGLRSFLEEYGYLVPGGLLLQGGEKTHWISVRVLAAPWWKVL